jgi:hypothetical protein
VPRTLEARHKPGATSTTTLSSVPCHHTETAPSTDCPLAREDCSAHNAGLMSKAANAITGDLYVERHERRCADLTRLVARIW